MHGREAGLAPRTTIPVEMARAHLRGGHDVITPQYLGGRSWWNGWTLAAEEGAAFA